MANENNSDLDTLIQDKIDADTEFQTSLEGLEEEESNRLISEKKSELVKQEFASMAEAKKKADEIATNQKIRAEKAEQEAKKAKEAGAKEELSSADTIALIRGNISDEDIETVKKFAKNEGISITEAIKNDELKAVLKVREEKRNVADATNITTTKRGSTKVSDETILDDANKGKLPDNPEELARARMNIKLKGK